ncbi:hypothetical protein HZH68_005496 [Vespula germanica]|uniref:Uncharacterized protein n=1 Tax=Vespula germanica TaxID=30212 RepID=A0A834NEC5_VESGE|nr:hypothetical protein HZH68_005496 [Vespula germanica]
MVVHQRNRLNSQEIGHKTVVNYSSNFPPMWLSAFQPRTSRTNARNLREGGNGGGGDGGGGGGGGDGGYLRNTNQERGTLHFATHPVPLIRYFTSPFTVSSHDFRGNL